jgi:transposase
MGRPAFHPKTLLKVALLALRSCRFSLCKIEQDTANNLAYKWLTGDMSVDHSTMGLFPARFAPPIVDLFSQVVTICREQNLIEFDLMAIDSIKLRANANYKRSKVREAKQVLLRRLEEESREVAENKRQELREKVKVNITDPDAQTVHSRSGIRIFQPGPR